MECRITEVDPPRKLGFTFGPAGVVSITLEPRGRDVLLTLFHSGVPDRSVLLRVSTGWHLHLDLLDARAADRAPEPFWTPWDRLTADYEGLSSRLIPEGRRCPARAVRAAQARARLVSMRSRKRRRNGMVSN